MNKYKICYLDCVYGKREKRVNANNPETAQLVFSNSTSYSKILSIEEI